jgi:TRAP transporter TAXI family solute receptor
MMRSRAQRAFLATLRGLALLAVVALSGSGVLPAHAAADAVFISVGTGPLDGLYYALGKTICELVNRTRSEHGVRCSAEPTQGSAYNLEHLATGELDLAIVQSDAQYEAYNGKGTWKDKRFSRLRAVLSFHTEFVAVVARQGLGAKGLEDLKHGRVNVGVAGSGAGSTWEAIELAEGWRQEDRAEKASLRPEQAMRALCEAKIDANVAVMGHPAPAITALLAECSNHLLAITGTGIDKLVRDHPYYRLGAIPGKAYGTAPIATFGPVATLVTSSGVDERIVAAVMTTVLKNSAAIQAALPALAELDRGKMITDALSAPQHAGAKRVARELGLDR